MNVMNISTAKLPLKRPWKHMRKLPWQNLWSFVKRKSLVWMVSYPTSSSVMLLFAHSLLSRGAPLSNKVYSMVIEDSEHYLGPTIFMMYMLMIWLFLLLFHCADPTPENKNLMWDLKSCPYDGVPFMVLGSKTFACHQGKDQHKKGKERRKQQLVCDKQKNRDRNPQNMPSKINVGIIRRFLGLRPTIPFSRVCCTSSRVSLY